MTPCFLGIDTSNYTTSIALCDEDGQLLSDSRQVLMVKAGERGLRQSEALFQHVRNLPEMLESLDFSRVQVVGIAASVSPRPVEDSYMPVFRAGSGQGRTLAHVLGIPFLPLSHQENHIRGAMYGCGIQSDRLDPPFLSVHFSGGTSEILKVTPREIGYDCEILGKTLDLNSGQLIDRIGVAMGLGFPAGKALEALARQDVEHQFTISSRVEGQNFHFSGQENQALALLEGGAAQSAVAYALFRAIGKTLERAVRASAQAEGIRQVVFSGGVMANGIVRKTIEHRLKGSGIQLFFTNPRYATDNAVGLALLAWEHYRQEK